MIVDFNSSQEEQRLKALNSYGVLDTDPETDFDELTELGAAICNTPIALISFVDRSRQWFKSKYGIPISQTDRCYSFCSHAIQQPLEVMEVEDTQNDSRFKDNPLVTGDLNVRFYAGMPLVDEEGYALGAICVIDHVPRVLNHKQKKALTTLAKQVIAKLSLKKTYQELILANQQLIETNADLYRTEEMLRLANTELVHHKDRLQTILDIMGEGIGITDKEGNIVYTNKRNQEIFNVDEKKMLTLTNSSPQWNNRRLDGSPLPDKEHPITVAIQTGKPVEGYEFLITDRKGRSKYLRMNTTPIKDSKGDISGAIGSFTDITQSYILQQKLKEREENLRMAIESANLGTWYINARTREFHPSSRLKELFGFYPSDEMSYDDALAQIPLSHRQEIADAIELAINHGSTYSREYPVIGFHDQKLRWLHATGKLYSNSKDSKTSHFSGTIADITERKLDEQRRNDFIGMVSHELRNPLTAIGGYVYILNKKIQKDNNPLIADAIIKINRQVKRMEALINGFLEVARFGEGKIKLNRTHFDMAHLVRIAEEESLATISSHQVIFHPVEYTPVEADQDKIEQVLINFINNAVKYSSKGTAIHVSCITRKGSAHVCVYDKGMGIPLKDQPFIFDRFYRVESEEMKTKKGFGIGLYICREIIEHHNGYIGVESVEGEGSSFWFSIPVSM